MPPLWLVLALLAALAVASQDAWVKKRFAHRGLFEMALYPLFYSLPPLALALAFIPVPPLDWTFAWCFLVSVPLNAVAFMMHMKAIRTSPLSLSLPFLAFTPVFMALTGFLVLGERPGPLGLAGIGVICLGGYILNIDPRNRSLLGPIRAVAHETGSWMMLLVALIYSFAAVIGKKGMLHSSPLFFSVGFFVMFNLIMVIGARAMGRVRLSGMLADPLWGLAVGAMLFVHIACHAMAIVLTQAAYMVAVKRLSILFSVIYGRILFKEANMAYRMAGAALMVMGTALITLQAG